MILKEKKQCKCKNADVSDLILTKRTYIYDNKNFN